MRRISGEPYSTGCALDTKISLIVRKTYGQAVLNMGGGGNSDVVLMWPSAEINFMDPRHAVTIVHGVKRDADPERYDALLDESAAARQARRTMRAWRESLQQEIDRRFGPGGGVEIEDKQATLSLHFRRAADPPQAERELYAMIAALDPAAKTIGGKFVVNVLPPGARTKLEALAELARELGAEHVAFVGDDVTDEIVFAAAPPWWLTVRVEPQGPSGARFALASQHQIARLIERMIELLPDAAAGRSRSS